MPAFVALLRAVNLPGHKRVAMADLRRVVERLGFARVETLLASGNVVFHGGSAPAASVGQRLERELARSLRLRTDVFVRTGAEWSEVVARNPFLAESRDDPAHLVVIALRTEPQAARYDALRAAIRGRERVGGWGPHAYIVYPDGIGRSKLTLPVIEAKLGASGTGRNWNTVTALNARAALRE